MKKLNIIAVVASLALIAGTANAESLRVIVKTKSAVNASSKSQQKVSTSNSGANDYKLLSVAGNDNEAVLAEMRASGKYDSVELDVMVSSPKPSRVEPAYRSVTSSSASDRDNPNDVRFEDQYYWEKQAGDQLGRANLIGAYKIANGGYKVTVGVIDSGFAPHADVVYKEGYSFTTAFGEVLKPDFYATQPLEQCDWGHGLSIVSLIGAQTNNNLGIAGVADVDIVAARAMNCGVGYLSDVSVALNWQAGKSIDGVPDISKKADVVNISIGGTVSVCPNYMQEAIDYATSQGVVVLVTANNDYGDVAATTPANCNNVIVVGAVDMKGQKADFSNKGEEVDLVAPGFNIIAAGPNDDYFWWDGTSQALPLATGTVALAKAEFPSLNQAEAEVLLKGSVSGYSTNPDTADNDCDNDGCGAGILDAEAFLLSTRAYMGGDSSFIQHTLADGGSCGDDLYLDFFGSSLSLCDMYEVTFNSEAGVSSDVTYELYQIDIGLAFDIANATKVLDTTEPSLMSGEVNIADYQYGYRVCTNGSCSGSLLRMNTSNAIKPESCP